MNLTRPKHSTPTVLSAASMLATFTAAVYVTQQFGVSIDTTVPLAELVFLGALYKIFAPMEKGYRRQLPRRSGWR